MQNHDDKDPIPALSQRLNCPHPMRVRRQLRARARAGVLSIPDARLLADINVGLGKQCAAGALLADAVEHLHKTGRAIIDDMSPATRAAYERVRQKCLDLAPTVEEMTAEQAAARIERLEQRAIAKLNATHGIFGNDVDAGEA